MFTIAGGILLVVFALYLFVLLINSLENNSGKVLGFLKWCGMAIILLLITNWRR